MTSPDSPAHRSALHPALVLLASFSVFAAVYLAVFLALGYGAAMFGVRVHYWGALAAVTAATIVTIRLFEHGHWPIGFAVPPKLAVPEWLFGLLFGAALAGVCDLLIIATTDVRHLPGSGFPWRDLLVVYIPAAIHEEVLFRGYIYQRIRAIHRGAAIAGTAALFALLHAGNSGVTFVALLNVFGGGVLLALAYERWRRLWFPIGLHLSWNVASGAVLGYPVSGYVGTATVLRVAGRGPGVLTGASFGLEGSVWALVVEAAGVALLLRQERTRAL